MCNNNKTERQIITEIRSQYMGLHDLPRQSLASSIKTLADDLYTKDMHFIFELIQNAEDNSYADGARPTLRFRLQEMAVGTQNRLCLVVENNEIGFEEKHVTALCQVGQSTKTKEQGYIGEKGIGFKSVFRITDRPAIHSNGFHFELPRKDEETGLGYIVPAWLRDASHVRATGETTIVLPLKEDTALETITTALQDIAPETILFLSKLRTIEIEVDLPGESYEIVIEKDDSRAPLVELTHLKRQQSEDELETRRYWVAARQFEKPADINQEKRQNVTTRTVSVAIPLDDGGEHPGKLFAYLPIWERTGLPFLINADFLLVSSREGIHEKETWNIWLRDCIAAVYTEAFMAIVGNETWPIEQRAHAYASIPTGSRQEWLEPVVHEIHEHLTQAACVLTSPIGTLGKPEFCRLPRDAWRELLETPDRYPAALGRDFTLSHSTIAQPFIVILNRIGVPELSDSDVLACLQDNEWLAEQSDDWLLRLYRQLMKDEIEMPAERPLVPARLLGTRISELCSPTKLPVYFRPDKAGTKALRAIPSWLRKEKPVAFLPKPLQRLINECDDHEKLREWITEELEVYPFTAGNYSVDVLEYLQDEKDQIGEEQLLEATKFLVEHAAKDFDWLKLPIVLADGRRMTVAEARALHWNGGEDGAQVQIQELVVPESYDPETGWLHIWRTAEDRRHFVALGSLYISQPRTLFAKIDAKDYPGMARVKISRDCSCRTDEDKAALSTCHNKSAFSRYHDAFIETVRLPSALSSLTTNCAQALLKWLKYLRLEKKSDYKWESALHNAGLKIKGTFNNYGQYSNYFDSPLLAWLKRESWLPTTKGLVRTSLAFVSKTETKEVLGDTVPYFEGNLSESLLTLLGVNTSVTVETLISRLDACRDDPKMDAKLPERIYRQLASRTQDGDNSGLQWKFKRHPLIFLPDRPAGQQWFTSKDCVWRDARELFGDAFGYLEQVYPRLRDFFVDTLKVKEKVDTESYAQRWLQLQSEPPPEGQTHRPVIAKLYRELQGALKLEPRPDWLRHFLWNANVYTQADTFEDPASVVVPDDGNLKRFFDGEVAFAWRPEHDAFDDWQQLYSALKVRLLSECVRAELDSQTDAEHVPKDELFLTPAFVQMIASWLREKERVAYDRLRENRVFERLFRVREERVDTPLQVKYTLNGIGNGPVVKSEDLPVFWDQDEFRLIRGSAEKGGDAKMDAAKQLSRFLLGSPVDDHGLSSWIELNFGESDTTRLKRNNWSVPREILDLSAAPASTSDEEESESQANAGNAPPSSAPIPAAPARPPEAEIQPKSEHKAPAETPASSTPPRHQPDSKGPSETSLSEHDRGGTTSPVEPDSVTPQEPDPAPGIVDYVAMLAEAFNCPGKTGIDKYFQIDAEMNNGRVHNPERRAGKLTEEHRERMANERTPDERRHTTERRIIEPADPQVRENLLNWYGGRCQICGETWPERDGSPFFAAARLVERQHGEWLDSEGNVLCLCAKHFAQWRHAAKEASKSIPEQVNSLVLSSEGGTQKLSLLFTMLGDDVEIVYCEKHFLALKTLLECA